LCLDDAGNVGLALTHEEGGQDEQGCADSQKPVTKILPFESFEALEYFCSS
jgi:hypothetical protein